MADTFAVLLAGGESVRMGHNKLLLRFSGMSVLERSVRAFAFHETGFGRIIIAAGEGCMEEAQRICRCYQNVSAVRGGSTRGGSVYNALKALEGCSGTVAIHDAARCLIDKKTISRALECAIKHGCGVAAIPVRDTLRNEDGAPTVRDGLYAVQTPQCFELRKITQAYRRAFDEGTEYTDDLGVWLAAGYEVHYAQGSIMNQKLTYEGDISFFEAASHQNDTIRIGAGEDTHRLEEGRALILGGVSIPYDRGLLGHSDADVLTHAVIDAMLGAAALGDIGQMFPDSDAAYEGICSLELLSAANDALANAGFIVNNIDATVTAQKPKLTPFILNMRENIAKTLKINAASVSVKATTTEGMNAEGRGECMTARAVCTIMKS